jgi:hypothetical protein
MLEELPGVKAIDEHEVAIEFVPPAGDESAALKGCATTG